MVACQLDSNFAELGESILDPEVRAIDAPGEQLLAGSYDGLRVRLGPDDVRYLLARDKDGALALLNLEDRALCLVPGVEAFGEPLEVPGRETVLPYISLENGANQLRFTRFNCESLDYRGGGLGLSLRTALAEDGGFVGLLAQREPASLVLFDPWQERERVLAEALQQAPRRLGNRYAWVDRGRIVLANTELEPEGTLGERIVYLEPAPDLSGVAFVQGGEQEGELFLARLPQLEPELVSDKVCLGSGAVRYLRRGDAPVLAGLWPCALGRLQLFDPASGTSTVVADNVTSFSFVDSIAGKPAVVYTTGQGSELPGLWLQLEGEPAEHLDASGVNNQLRPLADGSLLFYRDYEDGQGQLMRWRPEGIEPVADSVRWVRRLRAPQEEDGPATLTVLANFNGETGDLLLYDPAAGLTPLASGVPSIAPVGNAFLSDFADGAGRLTILDPGSGTTQAVADDVLPRGFVFAQQFEAVLLLRQSGLDADASLLQVHLLASGRTLTVADGVTESREVAFPKPGFVYSVPEGANAGVWFAEAL